MPLFFSSLRVRARGVRFQVEKEQALRAEVTELAEQNEDLDDQLMLDAESLQAKSDDISALLQKNEDISVRSASSRPRVLACSLA